MPLGTSTDQSAGQTPPTAEVASVDRVVPRRHKTIRKRFKPWSKPSPAKVREVIRIESRRLHISPGLLYARVDCESHYHWWASNGSYFGVLQFSPSTFARGVSSMKSHRVVMVRKSTRRVHEARIVHYSDGRVVRHRGPSHRQRVKHVYVGQIPRHPAIYDAWAQIRIGAQAIRGISAVHSSEWSCP